jgi:polysaccharide biosynthesis/export protein
MAIKTCFVSVIFYFSLLIVSQQAFAQTPNIEELSEGEVGEFYQRAQASGMSEMQIEQAALTQGFTLTDIAKMRKRVANIKTKGEATSGLDSITTTRKTVEPVQKEATIKPPISKIFGSNFFGQPSASFEPNLRIATPKNYQLGPDDELNVEIYGAANNTYKLKVTPEGTVRVKELAPIYVSGLTIEDARERIVGRLRQIYSGLNISGSYASITLGNIRSIKVLVTGEAQKPGVYTVSSLATAYNALYLCGGPSDKGTMRNIKVIRNNKVVRTIDFYDFLLNSDQADNIILQDQDIINIPYYTTRIDLAGQVKNPAIFETKDKETLKDVLAFAGGYTEAAYRESISLDRATGRERKIMNISQVELATLIPQTGDRYTVGTILDRYENKVEITGAVFRSGIYALDSELKTLKQLIKKADGFREDALRHRILIHREQENLEPELIAVDFDKITNGEVADIELKREDSIVIKSIKELREAYFVTVLGEINKPGDMPFESKSTVSDLVAMAGGFTDGAIGSRIEIARRIKDENKNRANDDQNVEIISLKIDKQLHLNPNDAQFVLQPFDIVYIRKSERYEVQKMAYIKGEVPFPGSYPIIGNTERIASLIQRAGGVKSTAYLPASYLYRKGELITVDMSKIISDISANGNLLLMDKDTIFIEPKLETVRITGAVLNPSIINFEKSYNFKSYLAQAGGYAEKAYRNRAFVTSANGFTDRVRGFWPFRKYPKIEPGATVFVPLKKEEKKNTMDYTPVIITFLSSLMLVLINKNI